MVVMTNLCVSAVATTCDCPSHSIAQVEDEHVAADQEGRSNDAEHTGHKGLARGPEEAWGETIWSFHFSFSSRQLMQFASMLTVSTH